MNDGAKVSGNSSGGNIGGGVQVSSGTFIMNGGIISGNTTNGNGGGGVVITYASTGNYGGIFTMYGGKITGNKTTIGSGGGILVQDGIFTMLNGIISGNTTVGRGGGVALWGGKFIMHGGIINGNSSNFTGGGVDADNCPFLKIYQIADNQNSGIIYGSEAFGVDIDGIPLGNYSGNGDAISCSYVRRNTTAWQTDHIDTTTGRGLSASGNPPFGQ
jgi:hypothetical protein